MIFCMAWMAAASLLTVVAGNIEPAALELEAGTA
jgi:hypothetical protein